METNESNLCVHRRLMRGPCDLDVKLLIDNIDDVDKLLIDNIELVDKLFKFVLVAYTVKSGLFVIAL